MSYLEEDHDMEIFEGIEGIEIIDVIDAGGVGGVGGVGGIVEVEDLDEIEIIDVVEGCDTDETQQVHEINRKSDENENPSKECDLFHNFNKVNVHYREIELTINTTTVQEVIFKKHRVQIINKHSRARVMEGIVTGYKLVGAPYDPDIILDFEDGRSFYNENFGYLLLFYI
jgi:DNA-binding IscR family transcriptional regulator